MSSAQIGAQGRDDALDLLEATRTAYLCEVRAWLDTRPFGDEKTVNDVREVFPVPEGIDGRVLGAVFRGDDWAPVRMVPSNRAHARPIWVFRKRDKGCLTAMASPSFITARLGDGEMAADAARYRFLRDREGDEIHKGGVFAGQTPENYVLTGDDLDDVIDRARGVKK